MAKPKLIRITTIPLSLGGLLTGQLKFMSAHYDLLGIASSGSGNGTLKKIGSAEGIRVTPVEMTRQITPLKDFRATWQLYRIFRREKPLIVHTHTPKAGTLGMLAAYLARVPHRLHTVAGMPLLVAKGKKRTLLDWVEKMTYACATKVYPNSFGLKDIIIENKYTRPEKLKVIGKGSSNGIDTKYFDNNLYSEKDNLELRKSMGIGENDYVFIFVGRLVKDKGINELVDAFKLLEQKGAKHCKLILVGNFEKELDPVLPKTENEIESNPNIIATGWQPDVRPYFAIANALAFPSYREGFPNVVMQAGAMGLPSIVTDINGCNEIVSHEENGYIIPAQSTQELYKYMSILYKGHFDGTLKFNSFDVRERICARYDRMAFWEALLKEYSTLN
ncbi:glycosyltransferase family 4 protein [Flagellimonas nanhaiensis]|uniref:Glycosyltransferase family 1 protein n=1 Tax=Flagellimonas nanhaiensis TaxID=2292706 RepID=A0A371JKW2_9FLAO|nr:glycosyltransferase family 4 protein [Allomuricauda nanhaiensis]RDY57590.1 glycosyltransferase family 1 protein [Allomuricauda nanhaiensis]